ncbi:MAG: indole-3-glycerol-phosphate synthase, partial [Candidatus Zixiibacteriota bacterium]
MLDEILYQKRKELEKIDFEFEIERIRKAVSKLGSIKSFSKSLTEEKNISLIAEIKRRSPSRG